MIGSLAGADEVKARNEQTATTFCAQKGQPMVVVGRRSYGGVASQDILTFRCGSATVAKAKAPTAETSGLERPYRPPAGRVHPVAASAARPLPLHASVPGTPQRYEGKQGHEPTCRCHR